MFKFFLDFFFVPFFQLVDFIYPKRKNYWGFAVHHIKSNQFIENARAVFEEVKHDTSIQKILFTRDGTIDFNLENANNTIIVNIKSLKGLMLVLKCKVLFVTHSISMDYSFRYGSSQFSVLKLSLTKRVVVNLWHGVPVKKLYALWNVDVRKRLDRVKFRHYERKTYAGFITSSQVDSYAMATMFHPIKYEQVWVTGLPRNDFILKSKEELPKYLESQLTLVQNLKKDKKLIIYAPTYRQTVAVSDSKYYQFTNEEIAELKKMLKKHNAIFGFRMHYFRNDNNLFNMEDYVDNEYIFDLGHDFIPEISSVIRESDVVISDYSSVFIESIYANKPVFAFTYDMEHYKNHQDGLLYDFDMIFPSKQISTFNELLKHIDEELTSPKQVSSEKYVFSKKFFYEYIDTKNSERVVAKVKQALR